MPPSTTRASRRLQWPSWESPETWRCRSSFRARCGAPSICSSSPWGAFQNCYQFHSGSPAIKGKSVINITHGLYFPDPIFPFLLPEFFSWCSRLLGRKGMRISAKSAPIHQTFKSDCTGVKIILMCFVLKIAPLRGEGEKTGESANFKTKHTEPLRSEIISPL